MFRRLFQKPDENTEADWLPFPILIFQIIGEWVSEDSLRTVPSESFLSLFYIKPQPTMWCRPSALIVFYLYSTSNHNLFLSLSVLLLLSFISILHQTTTEYGGRNIGRRLSFISILHQTTTVRGPSPSAGHCLLSLFYIKPQLQWDYRKKPHNCLLSLFYIKPQRIPHNSFIYRHLHLIMHTRSGQNILSTLQNY